ncbi:acetyltransferase [bacterium 336/3]|nr:acetyltransferase [bacterium 336/3]
MSVEIKKLTIDELDKFIELVLVFKETFEIQDSKPTSYDLLNKMIQNDAFHVFVAILDKKVIGGLTAYTLYHYFGNSPLIYIYDLAVKPEYQRQSIGKQLITHLQTFCKTENIHEIFVQVDIEDSHALDFYRSTGAISNEVVHFTYLLK